ncbi:MAG: hypothetical protein JWN04_2930, partial [Myxococcaceae bacterium]|nr:hypothetical protein [Myxococcaceae bacterium]
LLPSVDLMNGLPAQLLFEVGDQRSPPARADLVPAELAEVVLLVARVLAEFGETLRTGDRIMSGAFVERALPLLRGQAARACFGTLGEVRCRALAD